MYAFKPTNDIQLFEMIEIMKAVDFVIPDLVYDKLTRAQRHFQVQPEDTLAKPAVNPLEPTVNAEKPTQNYEPKQQQFHKKNKGVNFGDRV